MSDTAKPRRDTEWNVDWEGHRRQQLTAALQATPAQRLAWLEEALRIAHQSGALARARNRGD